MKSRNAWAARKATGRRSHESPGEADVLEPGTMNLNGENMHSYESPRASSNSWSIESCRELEQRLNSLSSLVCNLLRTNQELRDALLEATIDMQSGQDSQPRVHRPHLDPEGGR